MKYIFYILFFLMLTFPGQLLFIKVPLLIYVIMTNLITKTGQYRYTRGVLLVFFSIEAYGLYGLLVGVINSTPQPMYYFSLFNIWPIVYLFLIQYLDEEVKFIKFFKMLFWTHTFIVCYNLLFISSQILMFPFPDIYSNGSNFNFYLEEGTSRLNFENLNTLTFTLPILFFTYIGKFKIGISRILQLIIFILSAVLAIMSGRRSLMLTFLMLPIISLFIPSMVSKEVGKNIKKILIYIFIVLIILGFIVYFIFPDFYFGYIDTVTKAFDSEEEPVKFALSKMYNNEFFANPIFGTGFGYEFFDPYRRYYSVIFELSFNQKIAMTGIIGTPFILFTYFYPLIKGKILATKSSDIILFSLVLGYLFALLADATNPVLTQFEFYWPLYILVARINYLQNGNFIKAA